MKCHNSKKTYSGNENTPLGLGYSASGMKIGDKMRGKDKNWYVVINTKNGKRWKRVVSSKKATSPHGFISNLFKSKAALEEEKMKKILQEKLDRDVEEEKMKKILQEKLDRDVEEDQKKMVTLMTKYLWKNSPVKQFDKMK